MRTNIKPTNYRRPLFYIRTAFLLLFVMEYMQTKAQYDPSFAHYWAMEPSFNPAAAGKQSKINAALAYNITFAGFEHNPKTMYAAADMPFYFLKSYHGVGIQLVNDELGLFSHKRFSLQYAYRAKLFGGMLGIGMQLGMLSEQFDGTKVDMENPDDPAIPTSQVTGSGIDLGFGFYYTHGKWYAALSMLHATNPTVDLGERQTFSIDKTYYFTFGHNINLRNPFYMIEPSILARTDGTVYRVDITGRLKYVNDKKMMYGGLSYSPTNSVTLLVGGMFHGICIGYSYEVYTSAISIGNGSHEVFLGYQTDIDFGKKGRNRHISVRYL